MLCQCDRAFEARDALRLVGPHVGHQAVCFAWRAEVDRGAIAAAPFDHAWQARDAWPVSIPVGLHGHGRVRVSDMVSPKVIAEAVPEKVEAGTRADFQDAQRQSRQRCDARIGRHQHGRATDFVGLRRTRQD